MWLSPKKVIVGRGMRANAEGVRQIRTVLGEMGVEVIDVDMPVGTMHLMGMLCKRLYRLYRLYRLSKINC